MMIRERMENELRRLEEENAEIKRMLHDMPEGLLQCRKNDNAYKWFVKTTDEKKHRCYQYLPKKERTRAELLAKKTYDLQRLRDNEQEISALETCLKRMPKNGGRSAAMRQNAGFAELLMTKALEKELAEWKNAPYERNPNHEEKLCVRASNGEMVRSKSEAYILSSLYAAGIPFRYECRLVSGDIDCYPDFTIRRPADGALVIWEHFGLMSQQSYLQNAQSKIQKYIAGGFYPMENLITTFEGDGKSLDFSQVMDIVEWLRN